MGVRFVQQRRQNVHLVAVGVTHVKQRLSMVRGEARVDSAALPIPLDESDDEKDEPVELVHVEGHVGERHRSPIAVCEKRRSGWMG